MFIKSTPLLLHRKRFLKLYEQHKTFWNPDLFPETLQKKLEVTYKTSYYVSHIFRASVYFTMSLFYIQPIFKEGELLITCYVPDYPHAYAVILAFQYVYAFAFASFVCGFDILYVAYAAHLVVQLQIINYVLEHLDINDPKYLSKFRKCMGHHKFILRYYHLLIFI